MEGLRGKAGLIEFIEANGGTVFMFTDEGEGTINGDTVEPGREGGLSFKGVDSVDGFNEDFLGDIGSVMGVSDDIIDGREDAIFIGIDEGGEGSL